MKPKLADVEIRTDLRPGDIGAIVQMHGALYGSEHGGGMIGSMLVMHRGSDTAQLRYFLIRPEYRGIGLGRRLMDLGMQFVRERGYRSVYLWTVDELPVASAPRKSPRQRSENRCASSAATSS